MGNNILFEKTLSRNNYLHIFFLLHYFYLYYIKYPLERVGSHNVNEIPYRFVTLSSYGTFIQFVYRSVPSNLTVQA